MRHFGLNHVQMLHDLTNAFSCMEQAALHEKLAELVIREDLAWR